VAARLDHHAFGNRRGAPNLQFGNEADFGFSFGVLDDLPVGAAFGRTHFHQTHTAVAGYGEVAVVAIVGDLDVEALGRLDDVGAGGYRYLTSIDRTRDVTHVVSLPSAHLASNSDRYLVTRARTGHAAASPSGQIVLPSIWLAMSSRSGTSALRPLPVLIRWSTLFIHNVPSRHGVH